MREQYTMMYLKKKKTYSSCDKRLKDGKGMEVDPICTFIVGFICNICRASLI